MGAVYLLGRLGQALVASGVLVGLIAVLPWGLWHYIGWPFPERLPTAAEVQAVLLGPLSTSLLLDLLACLCWITWGAFVVDVARCVLAAARGLRWPELPASGPVHAVAAILVGVIVVSLLGNRSLSITTAGITAAISGHGQVVATTTVWTIPEASVTQDVDTVVVRAPDNGIHDSLSRIAQRTLGAAGRWPEIFALNKGKPQPYGGRLTNPNLIFPGERLTLPPTTSSAARTDQHQAPANMPAPAPTHSTPMTSPPAIPVSPARPLVPTNAPTAAPVPNAAPHDDSTEGPRPGITPEPGVFVGLGLAAAISAALVVARRRYRRRYRPGSGRRDDLPVGPVVYQLRLAHLRAEHHEASAEGDRDAGQASPLVIGATHDCPIEQVGNARVAPGLGVRDEWEIALDLAAARGLGLVGPGACAAARALLLALLTRPSAPQVIVPIDDLNVLLGAEHASDEWPAALRVVADLDTALDELETETLRRAREADSSRSAWPLIALVAGPAEQNTQRLQAILDNGAPFGLVGVLLGQWRPGISAYIRDDGVVSSASPGAGQALLSTQMFRLPETETAELLALLRQAQPESPDAGNNVNELAGDAALEVTAIRSAVPEGVSPDPRGGLTSPAALERPRVVSTDVSDNHPRHRHDNQPAAQRSAAITCATVAPNDPACPNPHPGQLALSVLGRHRMHWTLDHTMDTVEGRSTADGTVRDITAAFTPRQRELLVFLALHPQGVHRDALVAALWDYNTVQRPTNALNTALSRLRHSVNQATNGAINDLITTGEGRYQLDPRLVTVDYWRLCDAVAARRAVSTDSERIAAYQRIVDCYSGCLAEGIDTEWIEAPREDARRDALDAVAALARALVDSDPQRTLDLLETARTFDPHNELLYRDIMRLQHRLGHLDAIPRTLALLTTRLTEIDESPTAQTLELAVRLQQRNRALGNDSPAISRPTHDADGPRAAV